MPSKVTDSNSAHSIPKVCELLDLSHPSIYSEINSGRLRSFKVGRRRFVSQEAINAWIRDREAEATTENRAA